MMIVRANWFWAALLVLVCTACGDDDDDRSTTHDGGAGRGGASAGRGGGSAGSAAGRGGSAAVGGQGGSAGSRPETDAAVDAGPGAPRKVAIRFVPRVGVADFACGRQYPNQGSTMATVTATDFRFYVQDLRLIRADGTAVAVELDERSPWQGGGVALIDFENATGECAGTPETNDVIIGTVPDASYTGIAFTNGVPHALNHGNPPDLPAPLQAGGMQWSWLLGFRFVKAELKEVLEDGADARPKGGVGIAHPGATACRGNPGAGTVECDRPNRNDVRLTGFDPERDTIAVDLGAIFAKSDLIAGAQCHGGGDACGLIFAQLGIDYATGKALATQAVYFVE